MEDLCQLTERLTEDKYQGSYEQIARTIRKYAATPRLDVVNFFEVVLFSFKQRYKAILEERINRIS